MESCLSNKETAGGRWSTEARGKGALRVRLDEDGGA